MLSSTKKGHVLCVDDEPDILRTLHWLLRKDFQVQTARGGEEGLHLVKEHDFDVILSDQRMPKMTGTQFLVHVKNIAPRATRLLLTGDSDMPAFLPAVHAGEIWQCVEKPWDNEQLKSLVSTAAQLAQQRASMTYTPAVEAPSAAYVRSPFHSGKENSQ